MYSAYSLPTLAVIQQLRGQFLYHKRGQKQTFFDPFPPHLVHVVIERPLMCITDLFQNRSAPYFNPK